MGNGGEGKVKDMPLELLFREEIMESRVDDVHLC